MGELADQPVVVEVEDTSAQLADNEVELEVSGDLATVEVVEVVEAGPQGPRGIVLLQPGEPAPETPDEDVLYLRLTT